MSIKADKPWKGKLVFDIARHKEFMKLPFDWPRINQFPEWFVVDSKDNYSIEGLCEKPYSGQELRKGLELELSVGEQKNLIIEN